MSNASPSPVASLCLHCHAAPAEEGTEGDCSDACYYARQAVEERAADFARLAYALSESGVRIDVAVCS